MILVINYSNNTNHRNNRSSLVRRLLQLRLQGTPPPTSPGPLPPGLAPLLPRGAGMQGPPAPPSAAATESERCSWMLMDFDWFWWNLEDVDVDAV